VLLYIKLAGIVSITYRQQPLHTRGSPASSRWQIDKSGVCSNTINARERSRRTGLPRLIHTPPDSKGRCSTGAVTALYMTSSAARTPRTRWRQTAGRAAGKSHSPRKALAPPPCLQCLAPLAARRGTRLRALPAVATHALAKPGLRPLETQHAPVCIRCFTTSVGTRTTDAAKPAATPPASGARNCRSSRTRRPVAPLTGSYTPMNIAEAGTTPARLPTRPAYRALPPPDCRSARSPPPDDMACSRVLSVSRGYSAARHPRPSPRAAADASTAAFMGMVHTRFRAPASTAAPAVAPAARFPNTTRHRGASTGGAAAPPADASVITGACARARCAAFGLRRWTMRWPATDAKGRAAAVCWTAQCTLTSGSAPSSAPVALSCRATHRRLAVRAMATPGRLTGVRRPLHKC
jgi:hypothetical protein